jgi:hypothetical protein
MKTFFGIALIILGCVTLANYPDFGVNAAETFGVVLGAGLITFLPGYLLIRSDNRK